MSEPRRINLTQLGSGRKDKKDKEAAKTHRFVITLTESNEQSCPEFSYSELLKSRLKREAMIQAKKEASASGATNGLDLDSEEDAKLRDMARHFEEKYGGKKPRCGRFEDYVDLGAGYDENDTFIDNTDAYDEIVPEDVTTVHGGFYINSGALEFKRVEVSDQSDESQDVKGKKRRKQRIVSDDEQETEVEEAEEEEAPKRAKIDSETDTNRLYLKKMVKDGGLIRKKKKAIDGLVKRKKAFTVKALLEQKRERESKPIVTGGPEEAKRMASISDAIESVVSASRKEPEVVAPVSPEDMSSGSLDGIESDDNVADTGNLPESLPEVLNDELRDVIVSLKTAAKESAEGKCRFFSPEVNKMLLVAERKSRELSCGHRQQVFAHLAHYLPCTKDTLLKRAKKLVLEATERKCSEPLQKLRDAIAKESSAANFPSDAIKMLLCDVARYKAKCYEVSKSRKESAEEYLKSFFQEYVVPMWPDRCHIDANGLYSLSAEGHRHVTSKASRRSGGVTITKRLVADSSPSETPNVSPPIHVQVERVEAPVTPSVTPILLTPSVTPTEPQVTPMVSPPKPILDGELSKEIVVTPVPLGAPKLDYHKLATSSESDAVGSVINTGSVTVTLRGSPAEVTRHQSYARPVSSSKPLLAPSISVMKTQPLSIPTITATKTQTLSTSTVTVTRTQPLPTPTITVTKTQPLLMPNISVTKTQPLVIQPPKTLLPMTQPTVTKPQLLSTITKSTSLTTSTVTKAQLLGSQLITVSKTQPSLLSTLPIVTKPSTPQASPMMTDMLSQIIRDNLVGFPSAQPIQQVQQIEYRKAKPDVPKPVPQRTSPTVIVTSSSSALSQWKPSKPKKTEEEVITVEQEMDRVVQKLCEISGQNKSDTSVATSSSVVSSSQVHTITHGSIYSRQQMSNMASLFGKGSSLSVSVVDKPAPSQPSPKSVSLKQEVKQEEEKWRTQLSLKPESKSDEEKWRTQLSLSTAHAAPPAHSLASSHVLPGAFYSFQDAFHKHLQSSKEDEPPLDMAMNNANTTASRLNTSPPKLLYTGIPTAKLAPSTQYPTYETTLPAHSQSSPSPTSHHHHHHHHHHPHHHHSPHHHHTSPSPSHHTSPSPTHSSPHSSTPSPHHYSHHSHHQAAGHGASYLTQKQSPAEVLRHVLPASSQHSGLPFP